MNFYEFSLLLLNKFLPKKKVVRRKSPRSYFYAEYEWANTELKLFLPYINLENKTVLDIGCGLGGKTLFYAEKKVSKIIGLDIDKNYITWAKKFTNGRANIKFVLGSANFLPFKSNKFDIIFMNDLLEHIKEGIIFVLEESKRTIKNNGKICITFPPWTYPYAAHLYYYICIPWVHIIFSTSTIINSIKKMKNIPKDSIIKDFLELNKITIREFDDIIKKLNFNVIYLGFRMIKNLKIIKYIPWLNKYFVHRVVAVISK